MSYRTFTTSFACRIKACTLLELLVAIAIIAVLAGLVAPATVRSYRKAKASIYGSYFFHQHRTEAFLDDAQDKRQMFYATSSPCPLSFTDTPIYVPDK